MDGSQQHGKPLVDNVLIVGVGLIGGSIAKAAMANGVCNRVIGIGRCNDRLGQAVDAGVIHEYSTNVKDVVARCSLIVICTPVDQIVEDVIRAAQHASVETVITDVGSVKEKICSELEGRLPESITFIGSHPLAGSEKSGFEAAEHDLFVGRTTVVTPLEESGSQESAIDLLTSFWEQLGSVVIQMNPADHDQALGFTSHLPHLVASALASSVSPDLLPLAATGFQDTTRIAAGDPTLWAGILESNREQVLQAIDEFQLHLQQFRQAINECDTEMLIRLLSEAKTIRDAFAQSSE